MADPETIFLQPLCCFDPNRGREWSTYDTWGDDCPDHSQATEYVRADLASRADSEAVALLREALDQLGEAGYAHLPARIDAYLAALGGNHEAK